jgi:hypothetical protein
LFAGLFGAERVARVLLAMQKVEGSNPFSRFVKTCDLQVFLLGAAGWCVCFAPDRNRTRGQPTVHSTRRRRLFAGNYGSFEPLTSCKATQKLTQFDLRASPVSVRTRALARGGPDRPPKTAILVPSGSLSTLRPEAPDASSSSMAGADGAERRVRAVATLLRRCDYPSMIGRSSNRGGVGRGCYTTLSDTDYREP